MPTPTCYEESVDLLVGALENLSTQLRDEVLSIPDGYGDSLEDKVRKMIKQAMMDVVSRVESAVNETVTKLMKQRPPFREGEEVCRAGTFNAPVKVIDIQENGDELSFKVEGDGVYPMTITELRSSRYAGRNGAFA